MSAVTASDWAKGIGYSIAASVIGGASKLVIRLSWLMVQQQDQKEQQHEQQNEHQHHHQYQQNSQRRQEPCHCHLMDDQSATVLLNIRREENVPFRETTNDSCGERDVAASTAASDGNHVPPNKQVPQTKLFENVQAKGSNHGDHHSAARIALHLSETSSRNVLPEEEDWASNEIPAEPLDCLLVSSERLQSKDNNNNNNKVRKMAIALRFSGMVGMTVLNPLFCVLAMNYASPSILAPFSGLTLVWIVLFSETMIGEKPSKRQIIAACLIVLGEVIVAVWGDHTNDEHVTLKDVEQSYTRPCFILYFIVMAIWITFLGYILYDSPCCRSIMPSRRTTTTTSSSFSSSSTLKRFAWGVSGGSITGLQNFLKDSLTIIKACGETTESYPWYFYIFISLAILSSFVGLLLLTACMKRYDATFSSAMFVGSFVISASIMAAVRYQTFQHLESVWNWIMYLTGLIVLMVGVKILVGATIEQQQQQQQQQQEEGVTSNTSSTGGIHDCSSSNHHGSRTRIQHSDSGSSDASSSSFSQHAMMQQPTTLQLLHSSMSCPLITTSDHDKHGHDHSRRRMSKRLL